MDANKICFIMCVNSERYMQEAIYYINRLNVPDGYAVEVLTVQDAASMAAGYNEAMAASDAKYKVYLHQDVMIVEPEFISRLLDLFQDPKIGMVGMVGALELPENAVMWHGPRVGRIYSSNIDCMTDAQIGEICGEYQEVEALDGLLIATQYDVAWREDVFRKWDFYDVSQSFEFRKRGYKAVVPKLERPWCIHDDGYVDLTEYYGERRKFLIEYHWGMNQNEMRNDKVTLVLTMRNQRGILKACLERLCQVSGIHKMIFIDNASEDGTAALLSEGCDSILFGEEQGYGVLWNAALSNFQMDGIIVFMDVRYLLGRDCIQHLVDAVRADRVGIVGPRSNGFSGSQNVGMGCAEDLLELENAALGQGIQGSKTIAVGVDSGVWAVSKDVIEEVGGFREDLATPDNVLMDYELRMIHKGYCPAVCRDAFAYDLCAGQQRGSGTDSQRDSEILKRQWGMNYFNRMPNRNLADMIERNQNESFQVLEVGCDLGATLLEIKSRYPNCEVHGIEINPAAVKIAGRLADVKEGNIEDGQILFQEKFDYIIFGDVLEHLHDPQKAIRFCKQKLLKEGGEVIACIPNLMHISVMQQLLHGRFEYADEGLLDRTHIHFFTYYEILLLFQREGYAIENIRMVEVGLTKEQEELKHKLMELSSDVEMHMYDTFQYLVRARS